ncbi:unnamed protein product [Tilletia controversa]|uniref:Glycosyl hydrolase family 92 domain-containing protein n=1 Tax=Tilletia caries TaxID=13290 RepID=A0ABN7JFT2_9BASI|nr:unnamed protein product [Tilletia caries]CAD6982444.1 unnamed protein product [Tilletia controversa]CAD7062548.1 unnamed protein product [Tilletia caries]
MFCPRGRKLLLASVTATYLFATLTAATGVLNITTASQVPFSSEAVPGLSAPSFIRKKKPKNDAATADASHEWGSRVVDVDRMDGLLNDAFKRWRADAQNASVTQFDYAGLVNPFIGTEANNDPGNVFPGASIPFGMAKMGIDLTDTYAPAGYQDDINAPVRSLGAIHDSGTGSSSGSGGIFGVMPVVCPGDDFNKCPITVEARKRTRAKGKDAAYPGYFTTTLNNSITMETTTTRRAGLQRYTFDQNTLASAQSLPHLVLDWTRDNPNSWAGGTIDFDYDKGRIMMNGSWYSSFGVRTLEYQANRYRGFSCIDLVHGSQTIAKAGLWAGDRFGQDTKLVGQTHANLSQNFIGSDPIQSGALVSFANAAKVGSNSQVLIRYGVSYVSADQACANAEEEIGPDWDFDAVEAASRSQWNEKLNRIVLSPNTTDEVARLFYSSMYRSFLSPNNATLEAPFPTNTSYFDGMYCTWDTFRTEFPFLSLTSPDDYRNIVDNYIDGASATGWVPECRANNVPGITQVGAGGLTVIADYIVKYGHSSLAFTKEHILAQLIKESYVTPTEWDSYGRQINVYMKYGYVPFAVFDTESTGRQTREASRTLEYAFNDFGVALAAKELGDDKLHADMLNRSMNYRNTFDPTVKSRGFTGFPQKRRTDGTFVYTNPTFCSPADNARNHYCSLQQENIFGTYESSPAEYAFWAPHDGAGIVNLTSSSTDEFVKRLDDFFGDTPASFFDEFSGENHASLYQVGNEPSFVTPTMYHYAGRPSKSVQRVRKVVHDNFDSSKLPGNDDNAAMATLVAFWLLGFFPIPSTKELLINGFDPASIAQTIPVGVKAYVDKITLNGKPYSSRCRISWDDLFPGSPGKTTEVVLTLTADADASNNCGAGGAADLPLSLSTGGWK